MAHCAWATVLRPVRLADSPLIVQGQDALLRSYVDGASPNAARDVFGDAIDTSVVNLDRLCRTVHMLNYLPLAGAGGFLYLEVNPRHVLSIKQNHGAYFEEVLGLCGLTPEQVVIGVPFQHLSASYQLTLVQGLNNYRRRGYRLGVKLTQPHPDHIKQAAVLVMRLLPDFVKLGRPFLYDRFGNPAPALQQEHTRKLIAIARGAGSQVIQDGINTETDLASATALKAQLLEGDHFGQATGRKPRNVA